MPSLEDLRRGRYRTADEFDHYESTCGNSRYIGHRGSHSDWIYVPFTAHTYRMTETDALARGVHIDEIPWKESFDVPPVQGQQPEGIRCHIMQGGSPLCGFSHSRPSDWPKGHEWVPLDVQDEKEVSNCIDCIEAWQKLRGPSQTP